ncbi:hypothetical protein F5Y11DRAFT_198365 [Daldinia sp. FL1419]|nr:hypothetical protein F5Y11DRAFT_198365 [Daldinia sp. FL1419]
MVLVALVLVALLNDIRDVLGLCGRCNVYCLAYGPILRPHRLFGTMPTISTIPQAGFSSFESTIDRSWIYVFYRHSSPPSIQNEATRPGIV